ncbi:ribonuclease HII [Bartonella sp. TP]|uniref:ribonuclease HII n=1 Tax=Bartonella sp. TP TaxID=3057550 RepID=UPI0025B0C240|nr:ribonuclease HII [Bartonella sp. TP]MDN5248793.1 ribonuclease HII [Alphaproteobacteria bacterium]WJW80209.1 ribonuclease HII [Bartonella sp. TP]
MLCSNKPDFDIEKQLHSLGYQNVVGVDEVGRGCLAGPVVAAAVILDAKAIPLNINDSKKLTAIQRYKLYNLIIKQAKSVAIASLCARNIDKINIRQASLQAMAKAVRALNAEPDYVIIDGIDKLPYLTIEQRPVIKGDQTSLSIAAASIIAKVTRDRMLLEIGKAYPAFGFEKHVGYATKQHREALHNVNAIKNIHRFTFSPIKDC